MREILADYSIGAGTSVEVVPEKLGKRCVDLVLASLALILTLPLWLVFALAIKLEDGGPVFFSQRRWGRGMMPIKVLKFRTMVVDADARFGPIQAGQNDHRITRVGRLLRATSLDEMPQILSILKGEMSWVGPRALPINEVQVNEEGGHLPDCAIQGFDLRCRVKPGLTGMAQVHAARDVCRRHKFRYDRFYIEKQSLALDIKLIVLSLWITVRARWEERGKKL